MQVAAIAALLVYNCATLGRVPSTVNDDDGTYAAAAYQFWNTGKPGVPFFKDLVGLDRDVWVYGRTAAALEGIFLHFFGVSVFNALLPPFLAGIALLAATAALGRALWNAGTGLLAAMILCASPKFFEACRWARPDIWVALCLVISLALAAAAGTQNFGRNLFLSGLVMGLAGDLHLNGFLLAPVPLVFHLLLRPSTLRMRARAAGIFMGGGALGFLAWLALHYWPDTRALAEQLRVHGLGSHGIRFVRQGLMTSARGELQRYLDWFWAARGHRHLFEGVCFLCAGLWMALREGRAGRAVAGAWLAFFCVATLLMPNRFGWYLIYAWPLFALWTARTFFAFPARRCARLALAALFAAYLLNLSLWSYKALRDVPLQARVAELRRAVPAGAPLLASAPLWFAFWDRDFTDDGRLQMMRTIRPVSWEGEQRALGWRYVAASGNLRRLLDPSVPLEQILSLPDYGTPDQIREARAFSLARCVVEKRLQGLADTIVIFRVQ